MSPSKKRLAGRTENQLRVELILQHIIQKQLMERIVLYYKQEFNKDLIVKDNGVDNTGKYLKSADLNMEADYIVNGKKFEVKFIHKDRKIYRLKYLNLRSYKKQNAYVCIINGFGTENPRFAVIKPKKLTKLIEVKQKNWLIYKYQRWECKWVMEMHESDTIWYPLPKEEFTYEYRLWMGMRGIQV